MKKLMAIFLFLFFSTNLPAKSGRVKVLIIDGYSNHDWRYTTEIIKTMFVKTKVNCQPHSEFVTITG